MTAPGLFRVYPLCPLGNETDVLRADKRPTRGEMSSGILLELPPLFFFFRSRILSRALSLFQSRRILLPSREQGHEQSQRTKGHDGARVDRPHGGGSSARSRRDGRRRRAGGPGDGRDDCRRARGDASSARHTEGRHCWVQSQRGRGEGRALLGTRRCGEARKGGRRIRSFHKESRSRGRRVRERERPEASSKKATFFSFFLSCSSLVFLLPLTNDALRPAPGSSGGALAAAEAEHSCSCCSCCAVVPAKKEQEHGEDDDEKLGHRLDRRRIFLLLSAPGPRRPGRPALGLEGGDQGRVPQSGPEAPPRREQGGKIDWRERERFFSIDEKATAGDLSLFSLSTLSHPQLQPTTKRHKITPSPTPRRDSWRRRWRFRS